MDPAQRQAQLAVNLRRVRETIAEACLAAGRGTDSVTLVAVTKTVDLDVTRWLVDLGCTDLGEGRPQQLWAKCEPMRNVPVRWHLIGHLQRNKVKRTVPLISCIHSVDSAELLLDLDQAAAIRNGPLRVLIEVHISGDAAKHGVPPDQVERILEAAGSCRHVQIDGLMGMASLYGGRDRARREFAQLRQLRDSLEESTGIPLHDLSMGMSQDFDLAILEGGTLVRVGSRLFDGVCDGPGTTRLD